MSERLVLDALHDGKITAHEADVYLQSVHNTTLRTAKMRRAYPTVAIILMLAVTGILGIIAYDAELGVTGLVTYEELLENTTERYHAIPDSLSSLTASGTLTGEGNLTITYETENGSFLVAFITADPGTPRTVRPSYEPGASVEIEHVNGEATYYLDDGVTSVPVNVPFPAPEVNSTILIITNTSGELATTRVPLIIGDIARTTVFTTVCVETCTLPGLNGTAHIITEGGVATIRLLGEKNIPNSAPELTTPYEPVLVNETTTIDLSGHFTDVDADELFYSTSTTSLATLVVVGTQLTITPIELGVENITIYASDLRDLVPATFTLVVEPMIQATVEITNTTLNVTTNSTRPTLPTVNETTNTTIVNETLDCSNPDPNARPTSCLLTNATEWFPDQDVYWENPERTKVAKFNEIGNLLITGDVVSRSTGDPGPQDFVVGYPDRDRNTVPLVWINMETGDLHTRGDIIEEEASIVSPPGSYSIVNKRGVYLAYVDMDSGDLHLRGNIIPYRRTI